MKAVYRGHEIEVKRDRCLGGWQMLYYSIFRLSDGFECMSGFEDSAEKSQDKIAQLKERIDNKLADDDPWCEKEGLDIIYGRANRATSDN